MESTLIIEMAEKEKENITSAITEYGQRLFGFIRSKVKTTEDAEDLLQDVWYQLSNLSAIDELESVSGWLYKVAKNKVTDYYRKKKMVSLEDFSYENEEGEINFKEILLLDESDTETKLFKELFWEELMSALDELPEKQREVFVLNELEEFTLQEIANKTGENLKTIISRKSYAVKYLRSQLAYLYNEINNYPEGKPSAKS